MDNTHIVEDATMSLASGRQFVVSRGDSRAVITGIGAGLRSFSIGGCEFLDTYGLNEMARCPPLLNADVVSLSSHTPAR